LGNVEHFLHEQLLHRSSAVIGYFSEEGNACSLAGIHGCFSGEESDSASEECLREDLLVSSHFVEVQASGT
jgi:hypothetical protein